MCGPLTGCRATCGRETRLDPLSYAQTILASIVERQRWREQYEAAKAVDDRSATNCGDSPPFSASGGLSPPISPPSSDSCDAGSEGGSSRVKSVGRECSEAALTG